ncbi:autotransporter domain-containing protein [Erythrobacter sp. MTPC3]|uniref:autotransporter domain-containing protein n=1 Tax=Erythrobacter sp. MTPC3 TaxID=3056564 RepID=UPI0036F37978
MTIATTTKFRVIGGASALALSAGLSGTALAQATAPLAAAPAAPTAPTAPANAEQCAEVTTDNFVCAPGIDNDGVGEDPSAGDPADPITITIDDGAFVTGSTGFSTGASVTGDAGTTVTNNGAIVGGADGAVILNSDALLTNNGFISSDFFVAVRTGNEVTIDNTGTIYGNSSVALISANDGLVINNSGLLQNDAGSVVFSNGDGFANTVVTVNNAEAGQIFTTADDSIVLDIEENAVINNSGLIQSFGEDSGAIVVGQTATIVNDGNIATNGDSSNALLVGEGSMITNNGLIQTLGDNFADAIRANGAITVINNGTISTAGENSFAFYQNAGEGSTITNSATGVITTSGDNSIAIAGGTDAQIVNDGTISASGELSSAVDTFGEDAAITNNGTMSTSGDNADVVSIGSGATLTNNGTIAATGADSVGVELFDDVTVINSATGVISSALSNGVALTSTDALFVNFGLVSSATEAALTTADGDDYSVFNYGTLTGDAGTAVELGDGNDSFFALNGGNANGVVDAGDGGDTLYVLVTNENEAQFDLSDLGTEYVDFERFAFGSQNFSPVNGDDTDGTGRLVLNGSTDLFFTIFNSAFLAGDVTGTVFLDAVENPNDGTTPELNFIIADGGSIDVEGNDGIRVVDDGFTIANVGLIRSNFDEAIEGEGFNDLTVQNSGTILADFNAETAIESNDNLTVENRGVIQSVNSQAIVATGTGLSVLNTATGEILSDSVNAITGGDDVSVENEGLISGVESSAIIANYGSFTNSGTITATAPGAGVGAGIYLEASAEDSTITNEAGGVIEGDFGIFVDQASTGGVTVANFGTITGNNGEAVVLGAGVDQFQQWTGATTNGNVRLGGGDDTFVLEGSMSSILGTVSGGGGDNTALLGGVLDGDNLTDFGTITLGELFDLTVSGDRTLTGNVNAVGNTTLGLGVDTLTVDGDLTLDDGSTITVLTPLDEALLGQTVVVLSQTGDFIDDGATFDIIDDDLLLTYTRVGDASVAVTADNPLGTSSDSNIVSISNAVSNALTAGTLSTANFAALNDLGDVDALQAALGSALPSLSESIGREIFESSSAASEALDRHLAGEGSALWGQVIVRGAEQDALSITSNGYESDQLIFTAGFDFAATDGVRIGALASYADIENDDETALKSSEVDSIKLGLYAAIELLDRGFLNTEVAYLTGDVETAAAGFSGPITSSFDFDGFSVRTTAGYDLLADENVSVTPSIGVNAARINFDDTVETGGFGFAVERGDAEYIELRGGIELGAQMSEGVDAFIKGTVIKDLVDTPRSFLLSSTELPDFFARLPLREQDRFELAAGASIDVSEMFSIGLAYQGDFNEDYSGHAARATLRFGF